MHAPAGRSLALLTDLYQLTMAAGYWREGLAQREAVFCQYFRKAPFGWRVRDRGRTRQRVGVAGRAPFPRG